MENNKTAICIFCSNYFNSTVGEIAMKVFQKFSTFSNPTSGHRQMLKGWNSPQEEGEKKKKLSRLAGSLLSSWVRYSFDKQILTRWKQTQWFRTHWVVIWLTALAASVFLDVLGRMLFRESVCLWFQMLFLFRVSGARRNQHHQCSAPCSDFSQWSNREG